jgi:prefoldin subunit 5
MAIDFDLGAIVVSVGSAIFCAGAMFHSLKAVEKSVEEIKKDFKGIGSKLGRMDTDITYLKGQFDARAKRDI